METKQYGLTADIYNKVEVVAMSIIDLPASD